MIEVVVPVRTVSEMNQREHWSARARRAKAQRKATWLTLRAYSLTPPRLPLAITLTRMAPRSLDQGDNLNGSCKHVRDQVCGWLGVNDNTDEITWVYRQEKSASYGVRVRIDG